MTEPAALSVAQIFAGHTEPLPAVALLDDTHRRGIILGFDDNGHIELGTDGIALPVNPDTPAELITDPRTRARLLTEAFATNRRSYLWLAGELRQERDRVTTARQEREHLLGEVRAFLITCARDGQLDREQINGFLLRHHQQPYQPRRRVSYTITGAFEVGPDNVDTQLASLITVDLDLVDDVVAGSQTEKVTLTSVERVDADRD